MLANVSIGQLAWLVLSLNVKVLMTLSECCKKQLQSCFKVDICDSQSTRLEEPQKERTKKKKKPINLAVFVMKCFEKGAFGDGASRSVTTEHFHPQAAEKTLQTSIKRKKKKIRRTTN